MTVQWLTWGNINFHPHADYNAYTVEDNGGKSQNLSFSTPNVVQNSDYDDSTISSISDQIIPPFEVDGYYRTDLTDLSPYQFSRFDCRVSKSGQTVSFRKHAT